MVGRVHILILLAAPPVLHRDGHRLLARSFSPTGWKRRRDRKNDLPFSRVNRSVIEGHICTPLLLGPLWRLCTAHSKSRIGPSSRPGSSRRSTKVVEKILCRKPATDQAAAALVRSVRMLSTRWAIIVPQVWTYPGRIPTTPFRCRCRGSSRRASIGRGHR